MTENKLFLKMVADFKDEPFVVSWEMLRGFDVISSFIPPPTDFEARRAWVIQSIFELLQILPEYQIEWDKQRTMFVFQRVKKDTKK
jgi:hypothetical protein